jgi:hypothetical protein
MNECCKECGSLLNDGGCCSNRNCPSIKRQLDKIFEETFNEDPEDDD